MTFVTPSASRSDLRHSLQRLMLLLRIVFFCAAITGSGGLVPPLDATVVLFAQQEDKHDQNFYANAHPYLEEPLKKLIKRIPPIALHAASVYAGTLRQDSARCRGRDLRPAPRHRRTGGCDDTASRRPPWTTADR